MGIEVSSQHIEAQMAEIDRQEKISRAEAALKSGVNMSKEEREEFMETLEELEEALGVNATKNMFVNSIYNWLIATLKKVGNGDYTDMFKIEGSSIICNVPTNYFSRYSIPEGTKIEMKFINKKG